MALPTEPIGSIPRPQGLIEALASKDSDDPSLLPLYEAAVRDTVERFEATGSPVITDGEQRKYHNFWTYPVHGVANANPDGEADSRRALAAGFDGHLAKPVDPETLIRAIASLVHRPRKEGSAGS